MADETIQEGFEVFIADGTKAVGVVRQIAAHELVVYFENAGDRSVPVNAISAVHSEKVILDVGKLDAETRQAIRHVHDAEDPTI